MKNKVIIIGNDHVNTLGAIRTFGEQGVFPYVFIVSNTKNISVIKSKYVCKYWICTNEEIALLTIISAFKNEASKPVIIPTTDSAAYKIDEIYDIISKYFIVPNINNIQGNIIKYMDKYNQYKLLKENKIKTAKSKLIDVNNVDEKIDFPCIMKPVISAEGHKSDITICNNIQEFYCAIKNLKKLGYSTVLLQELICYDYELDISGFSYAGKTSIAGVLKKERIWPFKTGSTTFGVVLPKEKYKEIVTQIEQLMNRINYNGVFDIDCFVYNNKFYINEINFRNGALSYAYGKALIVYYWYLSNVKQQFHESPIITTKYYFMDDQADLHNVIDKIITHSTYKIDKEKSEILLGENKEDNRVATCMKINKIFGKLKLNGFRTKLEKICHKDINGYILTCDYKSLTKKRYNSDYEIISLNLDNYVNVLQISGKDKEIEQCLKSKNVKGIALVKEGQLIGRGFIMFNHCKLDRFFKIRDKNSYIITHLSVRNEFRGRKYQCDLILELIRQLENINDDSKFYAFVYEYNIPYYKNFIRLGFKRIGEKRIIRFIGKTINKIRI